MPSACPSVVLEWNDEPEVESHFGVLRVVLFTGIITYKAPDREPPLPGILDLCGLFLTSQFLEHWRNILGQYHNPTDDELSERRLHFTLYHPIAE